MTAEIAYQEALELLRQGQIEPARNLTVRTGEAEPEHDVLALNALEALADLAFQRGEPEFSLGCWQRLLAQSPSARAWNNLGSVQLTLKRFQDALDSFGQALALDPGLWSAQLQLGRLLLARRDYAGALPHLRAALPQAPALAKQLFRAGLELSQSRQMELADQYLSLCCDFPEQTGLALHELYASRAGCYKYTDLSEVLRLYALATQHAPHPLAYAWSQLNTLPYVYHSHAHLEQVRADFAAGLAALAAQLEQPHPDAEILLLLGTLKPPFQLAYQGQNDRPLMEKIGAFWTRLLADRGWLSLNTRPPRRQGPIRVGFVSSYFYCHSVTLCFHETITRLARHPDFEVSCVHLGARSDEWTERFRSQVQRFVAQPGQVSVQDLLALELDVLIYCDIGMDHRCYQLALHRLAPVQCLLPGHPVTSGLPRIDYYLSPSLCEGEQAASHYSETLIRIDRDISRFTPVTPPDRPLSRAQLGLPADRHLYFCPMTLFKLHPDFDAALGAILRADPKGLVYLAAYHKTLLHQILEQRFAHTLPDLAGRIRFLPWLDPQSFYSLILEADAVLDSFHFGGGTTAKIVLGLGRPLVTLPGEFLRGRITYGCYRRMGLEDRVPRSLDAYVAEALRLAGDADYRAEARTAIAAGHERLFSFSDATGQLAEFLHAAVASWPDRLGQTD
ncbi:MAG: tetratricopeptide repeat protein [Candidatus Sericytochromatia bacterium]